MRRYTVGVNVNDASELAGIGKQIRAFVDDIGTESELDVQVTINPLLAEQSNTHAIGFVTDDGEEVYEEEDE